MTLTTGETEKIFTALYEPQADAIPVDPQVTDGDKIKEEKPEGMVLVEFVVPADKAYMDTSSKFYVAKDKEVKIKPPVVYNKVDTYEFTHWQKRTLQEGILVETFKEDTTIPSNGVEIPNMEIKFPNPGDQFVDVIGELNGATGKLEVDNSGNVLTATEKTTTTRRGRRVVTEKSVYFTLPQSVQSGDTIKYWAEKDGIKSQIKYYIVK